MALIDLCLVQGKQERIFPTGEELLAAVSAAVRGRRRHVREAERPRPQQRIDSAFPKR